MSISTKLDPLKHQTRITLNDKFIGDSGANELAYFLANHRSVQSLEIKSNDISGDGFIVIFEALGQNPDLKELNVEYNNLGGNDYGQWAAALGDLIEGSKSLARLNISNNKITGEGFERISEAIARSRSLKLLELRYNNIGDEDMKNFVRLLKDSGNDSLLFVELAGNKIKKDTVDTLEAILAKNRSKNPITK